MTYVTVDINLDEQTLSLRWFRAKGHLDAEIKRYEATLPVHPYHRAYLDGAITALQNLKLAYFLTPEESSEVERTRREMFG